MAVGHQHVGHLAPRTDSITFPGYEVPSNPKIPLGAVWTHLVQGLPCDIDTVDLQDLIVDPQQPGALCQAPTDQTGYEHAWKLGPKDKVPVSSSQAGKDWFCFGDNLHEIMI